MQVLAPPRGTVPYPLLKENTLVLSDQMTLLRRRGGRLELSARVGDVYPNQARHCGFGPAAHASPPRPMGNIDTGSLVLRRDLANILTLPRHCPLGFVTEHVPLALRPPLAMLPSHAKVFLQKASLHRT